jgi:tetratricopeptide (TPR) repeat protein
MAGTPAKLDPFDVAALERSLNGSSTRASTIWVSFLIFALYLVIAAGTVSHRQLLLQDPVTLPVLNIGLPLYGFFFLPPILFVIFHAYLLLQVLLLGRTAAAYIHSRRAWKQNKLAGAYYHRGRAFQAKGDRNSAIADLDSAFRHDVKLGGAICAFSRQNDLPLRYCR